MSEPIKKAIDRLKNRQYMTVRELIKALSEFDEDMEVVCELEDGSIRFIEQVDKEIDNYKRERIHLYSV